MATELATSLQRGDFLSERDVADILARDEAKRAYAIGLQTLARRPRSTSEVAATLGQRGISPAAAAEALTTLQDEGLLDDAAFTRWWVDNRLTHRPRGTFALRHELAARGVAAHDIEAALDAVDEDVVAADLAVDLAPRFAHLGRMEFDQKVGGHLQRRGFGYEAIRAALETAWRVRLAPDARAAPGSADPLVTALPPTER